MSCSLTAYVTNDVTLSATAAMVMAAGWRRLVSRDASAQLRDFLERSELPDDEDEEENSGPASTAAGTKLLRLVSRDVVRLDT